LYELEEYQALKEGIIINDDTQYCARRLHANVIKPKVRWTQYPRIIKHRVPLIPEEAKRKNAIDTRMVA